LKQQKETTRVSIYGESGFLARYEETTKRNYKEIANKYRVQVFPTRETTKRNYKGIPMLRLTLTAVLLVRNNKKKLQVSSSVA